MDYGLWIMDKFVREKKKNKQTNKQTKNPLSSRLIVIKKIPIFVERKLSTCRLEHGEGKIRFFYRRKC